MDIMSAGQHIGQECKRLIEGPWNVLQVAFLSPVTSLEFSCAPTWTGLVSGGFMLQLFIRMGYGSSATESLLRQTV